jgi:predicted hydrocarbon binding protein
LKPQVPIEVDEASGEWSVDGIPMILVPRHFFLNNHLAVEAALGEERYAEILFAAGHKSAYTWCEKEARTHALSGVEIFHHYMKRLSQRGWGQFRVESVEPDSGRARVQVLHSVFALQPRASKACYMFRGWFPGSLEYVAGALGKTLKLQSEEIQCAAEGAAHCVFETRPIMLQRS